MLEAFGPLDDDDEEGGSSRRGADGGGACAGAIRTFAGKVRGASQPARDGSQSHTYIHVQLTRPLIYAQGYVLARFRTPEGAAQAVEGLSGRVMEVGG